MAGVDFYDIAARVKSVLSHQQNLTGAMIQIEQDMPFGALMAPWIGIYLDEVIGAPAGEQVLAAGQRDEVFVPIKIICMQFHLELETAVRLASDLVRDVHIALMNNRTLEDMPNLAKSWLDRVDFTDTQIADRDEWIRVGVITWMCHYSAII